MSNCQLLSASCSTQTETWSACLLASYDNCEVDVNNNGEANDIKNRDGDDDDHANDNAIDKDSDNKCDDNDHGDDDDQNNTDVSTEWSYTCPSVLATD